MKVLIVGSGGREHALAWKIAQSDRLSELYCAPGNAGTASIAKNLFIAADDIPALSKFAREKSIDLTIVGPEAPLCGGIVDAFHKAHLRIFGPTASAAQLEGDKAFAKQFMRSSAIPTADGRIFEQYEQARAFVVTRDTGLVVKAAGLAKGKGVIVCDEPSQALLALEKIMVERVFGTAGDKVVVEEKLVGPEVSVQALVEGHNIYLLEPCQDHKPLGEGDTGPNTGGMGAYSPTPILDEKTMRQIYSEIFVPAVDALLREGTPYSGVLYAGLMLTPAGPKVLEFNCRFGDPEAQPLFMRMQSDLAELLTATVEGRLDQMEVRWDPRPAVCVVMASGGYPGSYEKGKVIDGLDEANDRPDVCVFHAGTGFVEDRVVTTGGRVLGVTALGDDIADAKRRAYEAVDLISFEGAFFRRDIADRAISATARA